MAKPASGTTLDTGSSFYASLASAWAFLEGTGASSADSKGSNTLTLNSGSWSTDSAGDACWHVASAAANPVALTSAIAYTGSSAWSIAFRCKLDTNNNNGMLLGNNSSSRYIWLQGANYILYSNSSAGAVFADNTNFSIERDYVLAYDPSDPIAGFASARLFVNGVADSGNPRLGLELLFDRLMAGYDGSSTLAMVGTLSYFYLWNGRTLTSSDASTLHSSPYVLFGGGGGGGGVTEVALERGTRGLLRGSMGTVCGR